MGLAERSAVFSDTSKKPQTASLNGYHPITLLVFAIRKRPSNSKPVMDVWLQRWNLKTKKTGK